jgi:hypothetical protein
MAHAEFQTANLAFESVGLRQLGAATFTLAGGWFTIDIESLELGVLYPLTLACLDMFVPNVFWSDAKFGFPS